jgi:hypothetical protein
VGNDPKVATHWLDSSHGVHRVLPLHRHSRPCVHSSLSRRSGFGPEPPRSEHVPFLPFLPASTVFSAGGSDPKTGDFDGVQVCCTLQPVGGSPRFQLLCSLSAVGEPSPVHVRSFSLWRRPFEAFPSPVAWPLVTASFSRRPFFRRLSVHRTACLSRRLDSPARSVFPRLDQRVPDLRALFHRRVRCACTAFPPHTARCSHGL